MNETDRSQTFTGVTLLGRLATGGTGNTDQSAWQEFVDRYGPHVLKWCRHCDCPESDVEDVLQEVLLKLMQAFQSFRYDPKQRFRSWLKAVTRNAAIDIFRSRQFRVRGSGDTDVLSQLQATPAQDDLYERINAAFDLELFELACSAVRARVEVRTWRAFEMTTIENVPPKDAATQLEMSTAHLYVAISRVKAQLKDEVNRLKDEVDGGEP